MIKLIVVLGISEYEKELKNLFQSQKIPIFSELPIKGFKTETEEDEMAWFKAGNIAIFSNLFFAFVEESKAENMLNAIREFNEGLEGNNPFHAFLMNVERSV